MSYTLPIYLIPFYAVYRILRNMTDYSELEVFLSTIYVGDIVALYVLVSRLGVDGAINWYSTNSGVFDVWFYLFAISGFYLLYMSLKILYIERVKKGEMP